MPRKGKSVRPIGEPADRLGKFENPSETLRRTIKLPAHPVVVCSDLRNGSLASLDAYLQRNKGIPDREVALELRKLISGSTKRTKFRIVVVDHPDASAALGGRPTSKRVEPTRSEVELAEAYETHFAIIGKVRLSREQAAEEKGVSTRTIQRAVQKVESWEAEKADWQRVNDRRKLALNSLREQKRQGK